ncbi:MAG: hypothetical protein RLZZ09_2270 [Pseudomonadota bacterium]
MSHSESLDKLAAESGVITWPELQRHFARGVVVVVSPPLDLLGVAAAMARDDTVMLGDWMQSSYVLRATDEQARQWELAQPALKAVVVAPWVLVQEIRQS